MEGEEWCEWKEWRERRLWSGVRAEGVETEEAGMGGTAGAGETGKGWEAVEAAGEGGRCAKEPFPVELRRCCFAVLPSIERERVLKRLVDPLVLPTDSRRLAFSSADVPSDTGSGGSISCSKPRPITSFTCPPVVHDCPEPAEFGADVAAPELFLLP